MVASPKELLQKYFENKIIRWMPLEAGLWSGKSSRSVSAFPCLLHSLLSLPPLTPLTLLHPWWRRWQWLPATLGAPQGQKACLPHLLLAPNSQYRAQGGQGSHRMLAEGGSEWLVNEWANEWVAGWGNEWMNMWVSEWLGEGMNDWVNAWMAAIRHSVVTY